MKIIYLLIIVSFPMNIYAGLLQEIEISSSFNPVGSGARALGMGGAFIGIADDATAASWNPGGLSQLETPEISIVGSYYSRDEDSTFIAFPEASGAQEIEKSDLNFFSVAYPFVLYSHNMIVSLNYQSLYDFDGSLNMQYSAASTGVPRVNLDTKIDFEQEGKFQAISPAFAVQLSSELSIGVTFNFWRDSIDDNGWTSKYREEGKGTFGEYSIIIKNDVYNRYEMDGFNCNFGLLWDINNIFSLGFVYKTPFTADLDHEKKLEFNTLFPGVANTDQRTTNHTFTKESLGMPATYGVGISMRFSDSLCVDLDLYTIRWDDLVMVKENGYRFNPISNKPESESNMDKTTHIRLGGEYLLIKPKYVIPFRAGMFYDPEPAENEPDDYWGFSLGSGVAYGKTVFDVAYQYRFGNDVRSVVVGNEESYQDIKQHTVYVSFIFHF